MSKTYNAFNSLPKILANISVGWLAPMLYIIGLCCLTVGISKIFPLQGIGWIGFGCGIFVPAILFVSDSETSARLTKICSMIPYFIAFILGLCFLGVLLRFGMAYMA